MSSRTCKSIWPALVHDTSAGRLAPPCIDSKDQAIKQESRPQVFHAANVLPQTSQCCSPHQGMSNVSHWIFPVAKIVGTTFFLPGGHPMRFWGCSSRSQILHLDCFFTDTRAFNDLESAVLIPMDHRGLTFLMPGKCRVPTTLTLAENVSSAAFIAFLVSGAWLSFTYFVGTRGLEIGYHKVPPHEINLKSSK